MEDVDTFHSRGELPRLVQARDRWVRAPRDAANRGGIVSTLAGSVGEGSPTGLGHHLLGPSPDRRGIWSPHWTGWLWAVNSCTGLSAGSGGQEGRNNVGYRYGSDRCTRRRLRRFHAASVLQAGPARRPYLPIGRHLQAEAGLHAHELLIVPQPVGHGQGEGRLLILQAGDRALKGTDSHGEAGGRELRWVALRVPTVRDTKGKETPPAL